VRGSGSPLPAIRCDGLAVRRVRGRCYPVGGYVMYRVEVFDSGVLIRVRVCPNVGVANGYAQRCRAHGLFAFVSFPRGEIVLRGVS